MLYFYICKTCGNLILKIEDGGNTPVCCGKQMTQLRPASTDGAKEKHVPIKHFENLDSDHTAVWVNVGSESHPMESYHYIQWIVLETDQGIQLKRLHPGDSPQAIFFIDSAQKVEAVYAYCNLHGLWIG